MSVKAEGKNCRWVLADGGYCAQQVRYHMVWDGGEIGSTKVRQYESFCPEHLAKAKRQREQ